MPDKEFILNRNSSLFLDFLRAFSAQLVVVGHAIKDKEAFALFTQPHFPYFQSIAVTVFFILSGFLISYSLDKNMRTRENYNFSYYFADRFSRIYTVFIPALLFILIFDQLVYYFWDYLHERHNLQNFLFNIFLLQDFPIVTNLYPNLARSFGTGAPLWTLAIEWWIYLFVGYFVFKFSIKRKVSFKNILILSFLSPVPIYNFLNGRGTGLFIYWLVGALGYFIIKSDILSNFSKNFKIILTIVLFGISWMRMYVIMYEYDVIFSISLALTIIVSIDLFKDFEFGKISESLIRYVASYSYTIYLIHFTIFSFTTYLLTSSGILTSDDQFLEFIAKLFFSNIISIAFGRYFEITLTKKVKKYMYKRVATN